MTTNTVPEVRMVNGKLRCFIDGVDVTGEPCPTEWQPTAEQIARLRQLDIERSKQPMEFRDIDSDAVLELADRPTDTWESATAESVLEAMNELIECPPKGHGPESTLGTSTAAQAAAEAPDGWEEEGP